MNLKLLPPLLAVALVWGGAQSAYTSLKNGTPEQTTCGRVQAEPPDGEWLSISDCAYDFEHLVYGGLLGTVSELYIPLRPKGDVSNAPSRVVLLTEDTELVALVRAIDSASDPADVAELATRLAEREPPARITGLVKFGIELKEEDERKLRAANPALPEDFVLLEQGERPMSAVLSFSLMGAGLLLGAWLGFRYWRSRSEPAAPA